MSLLFTFVTAALMEFLRHVPLVHLYLMICCSFITILSSLMPKVFKDIYEKALSVGLESLLLLIYVSLAIVSQQGCLSTSSCITITYLGWVVIHLVTSTLVLQVTVKSLQKINIWRKKKRRTRKIHHERRRGIITQEHSSTQLHSLSIRRPHNSVLPVLQESVPSNQNISFETTTLQNNFLKLPFRRTNYKNSPQAA